jgi:hypothetical protein
VLIVSRKQKRLAVLDRPSDRRAKLVLLVAGIETQQINNWPVDSKVLMLF